jgi:hypothetical protein
MHLTRIPIAKRLSCLLVLALGFVAARAGASGGVRVLPLEKALQRSSAVFVVERGEPFQSEVPLRRQSPRARRGQGESLSITYLSFIIRETLFLSTRNRSIRYSAIEANPPTKRGRSRPSGELGLYQLELPKQPLELIWLINDSDVQNMHLTRMRMDHGVNRIPIYQRLEGGLMPEAIVAGQPYLLLAVAAPEYQSYEGIGGWGLLDCDRREEVERLLQQEMYVPALPEIAAFDPVSTQPPNAVDDADVLETVFRYQVEYNDSALQQKAAAYCIQLDSEFGLPQEFMRRFRNLPKVKNVSGCALTFHDRCDFITDRRTQQPALRLSVQSIRRVSPDTVVVVGGFVENCENIAYYEYVLRRDRMRWVIIRNSKIGAT